MTRGTREATRARIVDAATELFSERGYSGTSVDAIAERARMTTGALYSNFTGKREVFRTALLLATGSPDEPERSSDTPDAAATADGVQPTSANPDSAATDPARAHAESGAHFLNDLDANPGRFRLLLWAVLEANRDPEVADVLLRVLREQRGNQSKFLLTTPRAADEQWVADSATQLNALALGIGVQHLVEPDYVTTELAKRVLGRTIAELSRPAGPRPESRPLGP